jgi:aspartokinase
MNITKITEEFIRTHPFIKQSIKINVINYSKLARMISKEKNISNFDAILIACRRYFRKLDKSKNEANIIDILKGSKLSIRNKIVVVILEPDVNNNKILDLQKEIDEKNEIIHVVRGANATTLITTEDFLEEIKSKFKNEILKLSKNQVEIILKSSTTLESVPGVTAYIYSLFGDNNINIQETLSCWTDTIIIINKDDLAKTMDLLNFE